MEMWLTSCYETERCNSMSLLFVFFGLETYMGEVTRQK